MKTIRKEEFYQKKNCQDWQEVLKIDNFEKHRLKNWTKIDGEFYYIKELCNYNEIIGELIANSLNLKSAHYEIGKYKKKLKYMTKNFKEDGKEYLKIYETEFHNKDNILDLMDRDLRNEVLKMYALDIFMMQTDRCNINVMFEKENGKLKLAPLYDYSCAYLEIYNNFIAYRNCIQNIYMYDKDIYEFMNKYPIMYNYLQIIDNTDYLKLLKDELLKYEIELKKREEDYIEREFNEGHMLVKRMVN